MTETPRMSDEEYAVLVARWDAIQAALAADEEPWDYARSITETYATRRRALRKRSGTLAALTIIAMAVLAAVVTRSAS